MRLFVKNVSQRMHPLHVYVLPGIQEEISADQLRANARGIAAILRFGEIEVFAIEGNARHDLTADDVEEFATATANLPAPPAPVAAIPDDTKQALKDALPPPAKKDDEPPSA